MTKILSCAAAVIAFAAVGCAGAETTSQGHVQFAVPGEVGVGAPRVVEERVVSKRPKMMQAGSPVPVYLPLVIQHVAVGGGRSLVVWNDETTDNVWASIADASGAHEAVRLSTKTAIGSPRVDPREKDVVVTFFAATDDGFEEVAMVVDPNP